MGQGPSRDAVTLEIKIEDPEETPRGLALIAHGRLGGTFDQPVVRLLAEYLRETRKLRVVTWNARGMGQSKGGNEWTDFGVWLGDAGIFDYKVRLSLFKVDANHSILVDLDNWSHVANNDC